MTNAPGIQALLLTADALLINNFSHLSRELGIDAQSSADPDNFSEQLNRGRYEALLLDFDTVPGVKSAMGVLRSASRGKNTVVFAVASNAESRDHALRDGAHFLLQRPIDISAMREALNAAYDLMCSERRRYYRCIADLPVLLTLHSSGATVQCSTLNVSSDGMAVSTPIPFIPAETADFALPLSSGFIVRGTAIVIWDDKHGKSGMKMRCGAPFMRQKLDEWLDNQLNGIAGKESEVKP